MYLPSASFAPPSLCSPIAPSSQLPTRAGSGYSVPSAEHFGGGYAFLCGYRHVRPYWPINNPAPLKGLKGRGYWLPTGRINFIFTVLELMLVCILSRRPPPTLYGECMEKGWGRGC